VSRLGADRPLGQGFLQDFANQLGHAFAKHLSGLAELSLLFRIEPNCKSFVHDLQCKSK
jgi:hypothetical protein